MSNRIEKVNSLLQAEIGKILLRDFAFSPEILVTLTRVETTANLIEAKAYISVFFTRRSLGGGGPEEADNIIKILNKNIYDIQFKINRTLRMRPIPKIKFVKETEVSRAARIEELLAKASADEKVEKK